MWQKILNELKNAGLRQHQIADRVGVSQPTINRLAKGVTKKTDYETGEALVALHKKTMAEIAEQEGKAA